MEIFSVYDVKAEAYMQPFFSRNTGTALRSFSQAVNEESHEFNRHAEDYSLWRLGDFDERSGKVGSCVPVQITGALQVVEQPEADGNQLREHMRRVVTHVPQGGE